MFFSGRSKKLGLAILVFMMLLLSVQFLVLPRFSSKASTLKGAAVVDHHYLYAFPDGSMYVYDIDNGYQLVKTVSLPMLTGGRGVVADPASGMLYIAYN